MIKRKLQVILFGALLTFSAAAQSQTTINNPLLTQLARQFVAAVITFAQNSSDTEAALALNTTADSLTDAIIATPAAGSLVINGTVRETRTPEELVLVLFEIVESQPDTFDPGSVTIITAASPNS